MRLTTAEQDPEQYIDHYFGYSLDNLLSPIGENEVGDSVRHNGVYFNIKEARQSDDPTLPQGVWTHDLKTADWSLVKQLALDALSKKCKDLQLLVWLFEANIHLHGFGGIAPAATLILQLCEHYWETMHPKMEDGDLEYRTNPINWINDKLTPVLNQVPITKAELDGLEYSWEDWENAQRYEKLKSQNQLRGKWEGATTPQFKQKLGATSSDILLGLAWDIEDGLTALVALQEWLDEVCGNESPSLSDMTTLLGNVYDMVGNELHRRGVSMDPEETAPALVAAVEDGGDSGSDGSHSNDGNHNNGGSEGGGSSGGGGGFGGPIRDRTDAFIALRRVADYLMNDDPHSPVPYLVYTACDWGDKSAPDLYRELFLEKGGQLNIFEMMGLAAEESK